ncbi:methyltransferase [Photorhabdus luminescens]|uniref:Methyltransferase n=1 Tax=Photorhabdus luminescens subsp. mexicana TaxID=2100167 RepID=A0A4R4IX99_PHOLU|nr:methyltransferase [Photorhabdus luminescens]TDB45597.1 methyltransferase [Photorhabdus luminescens subsp. mexicana]
MIDLTEKKGINKIEAISRFTELADYIIPFTIRSISELKVADCLVDGPKSVAEIAKEVGANEFALYRAMLALASKGIFAETDEPGIFEQTAMSELLSTRSTFSLRNGYRMLHADIKAWSRFDYSLRTGKACFDIVHDQDYWDFCASHKDYSLMFDNAMATFTPLEYRAILAAYDFSGIETIVDIGGGNGRLLSLLLKSLPHVKGKLFDQPHVVNKAHLTLENAGVLSRCEIHGGSFFDAVPGDGDLYIIKRVIYDWDDERAAKILSNVAQAMNPSGKVAVIDPVLIPGNSADLGTTYSRIYDLLMMAMVSGHARSEEQSAMLFDKAGLKLTRVIPTMLFPIVEGIKK